MYKALAWIGAGVFTVLCVLLAPILAAFSLLLPYIIGSAGLLILLLVGVYDFLSDIGSKNESE